jgi:putative hydrolase of the HAD superfamily
MIKAIIFDFDGLILDTETPWFYAYRALFEERGATLPLVEWAKCIGTHDGEFNPMDYLEQQIGKEVDRIQFKDEARLRYAQLVQTMQIRPGVVPYLESAQKLGLRIGLASSSDRYWVESYLNKYGLFSYFEVIRTMDDVAKVKPDPELYLQALEHLGVRPNEAIVFEDSLNGLRAAKAAGTYCVIVPNEVTNDLDFVDHDLRLKSMEDMSLTDIIKRVA